MKSSTPPAVPSRAAIDAELATRHLSEFVKQAWPIVEPGAPLAWNWHLDIICDALERQTRDEPGYRRLLICVPPGTMKSLLVSVFQPAWQWLRDPSRRKLFLANDADLAVRDSRRTREVLTSEWYQELVARIEQREGRLPWGLAHDQNEKVNFANSAGGFRQCRSIGSKITGKRADDIVIDDPLDAKEVVNGSIEQVSARLDQVANVIEKVLPSRVNRLADARWTIIMQRLHDDDTAARAMRDGDWHVINLQMEYEPDNPLNHPDDPRKTASELLFPGLFPHDEVKKLKYKLGNDYSAQYQQNPLPRGGGPLKSWYWRYWYPAGIEPPLPVMVRKPDGTMHGCAQMQIPDMLFEHTQSWDMAFKDTRQSAYVVGQVWANRDANMFLLDQVRDKMDINATLDAVLWLTHRWPQAHAKLVEDKANGTAVIAMLRDRTTGLIEVNPQGGKEARANAAAPAARSGNVYLPHPSLYPWVNDFVRECEAFPAGRYADQVDCYSQYVIDRLGDGRGTTENLAHW